VYQFFPLVREVCLCVLEGVLVTVSLDCHVTRELSCAQGLVSGFGIHLRIKLVCGSSTELCLYSRTCRWPFDSPAVLDGTRLRFLTLVDEAFRLVYGV